MNQDLLTKLARLPRLDPAHRQVEHCKVCANSAHFFDVVDFNKTCSEPEIYPFGPSGVVVQYYRCTVCSFIFTPFFDDWTPQEFTRFIYNDDYIKVDGEYAVLRPEREAADIAKRLARFSNLRILDYGSGSGAFADALKSKGFDSVSAYDPFSSPARPKGRFDLITCFEVLEHTIAPRTCLNDIVGFLESDGCILFTTGIQPPDIRVMRANWWYVAPRNGHVSIYSLPALARLGPEVGLSLYAGPQGTAFAGDSHSDATREILLGIGNSVRFFHLTAPSPGTSLSAEDRDSWHGLEGLSAGAGAFRWTRNSEMVWRLQSTPIPMGDVIVSIPIQNEVEPGFADRCRLEIGTNAAPLVRRGDFLTGTVAVRKSTDPILKLITPPPRRPCDLRPVKDARLLGLAVSISRASMTLVPTESLPEP